MCLKHSKFVPKQPRGLLVFAPFLTQHLPGWRRWGLERPPPRDSQPRKVLMQPETPSFNPASCSTGTPHPPLGNCTQQSHIVPPRQVPAARSGWKPVTRLENPGVLGGPPAPTLHRPKGVKQLPAGARGPTRGGSCRRELSWIASCATPRSSCKWTTAATWTWRASSRASSAATRRLRRRARLKWRLSTKPG